MDLRKPVLASLGLFAVVGVSHGDDVDCPPDLGAVTVDGNVLIAAPCTMEGTTVTGNIELFAGGSLIARDLDVEGNIQADDADFVQVETSIVDGSIQLEDLVGDASNVISSTINGNIQLDDNRSRLEILDNRVDGDIQAFENSGGLVIADNVVDGNLQCKDNEPAPVGSNNRVSGNMEDQCADLQPEGDGEGDGDTGGDDDTGGDGTGGDDTGGDGTGGGGTGGSGDDGGFTGGSGGGSLSLLTLAMWVTATFARLARRRRRRPGAQPFAGAIRPVRHLPASLETIRTAKEFHHVEAIRRQVRCRHRRR